MPTMDRDQFIEECMAKANIFVKYRDNDKAIKYLEGLLSNYSDCIEAITLLKDCHVQAGDREAAAEKCRELANLLRTQGKADEAGAFEEEASSLLSDVPPLSEDDERQAFIDDQVIKAEVFLKYGLPQKAAEELELILERFPDSPDIVQRLEDVRAKVVPKPADVGEKQPEIQTPDLQAFEVATPESEGATPGFEIAAPESEAATPGFEIAAPESEAAAPGFEIATPESEAAIPGFEIATPESEIATPEFELVTPEFEVAAPDAVDFVTPEGGDPPISEAAEGDPLAADSAELEVVQREETAGLDLDLGEAEEVEPPAPAPAPVEDGSLESILAGLHGDAQAVKLQDDDPRTQYNLGQAYMEMQMFDQAVASFRAAIADESLVFECCNLLGHCLRKMDKTDYAIKCYEHGLTLSDTEGEERLGLLYELGSAFEESGDLNKALDTFVDVFGMDPDYRSVGDKITMIEELIEAEKPKSP